MNKEDILVSICCITYNHASYIRQCLDGFMMQKTDFKFEVLIHDDASTDGTEEIIREYEKKYPEVIKPLYEKENQWVQGRRGNKFFNYPRAIGKYIALCEGDDYWIDPYKLQKQVDFLENNLEYSYICHRYLTIDQDSGLFYNEVYPVRFERYLNHQYGVSITCQIFHLEWLTKTLSALIRRSALEVAVTRMKKCQLSRDVHLFYFLLYEGLGFCHNMISGVYRVHRGGVCSLIEPRIKVAKAYDIYRELYLLTLDEKLLYPLFTNSFRLLKYDKSKFFDCLSVSPFLNLLSALSKAIWRKIYYRFYKHLITKKY